MNEYKVNTYVFYLRAYNETNGWFNLQFKLAFFSSENDKGVECPADPLRFSSYIARFCAALKTHYLVTDSLCFRFFI